jgi:adenine-specific DNA-methyltransferase
VVSAVERSRLRVGKATAAQRKSDFGQFFTPASIAQFMAGLFEPRSSESCRLLDAGAGVGSLSAAFLERWTDLQIQLDAFEIDETLHSHLHQRILEYGQSGLLQGNICGQDFIEAAVGSISGNLFAPRLPKYTHAILNPPYKKIHSNSRHRAALRQVGIDTVNLYSAFVALALALLEDGGQLVAIIPRSFCNGPYYRPFRKYLFQHSAIRQIHLFDSRRQAFKDDDVLQENLILVLERGASQGKVTITTSTDDRFTDLQTLHYEFDRIVLPDDPEQFIHVPTSAALTILESLPGISYSLAETGIQVSTGPVVDFRLKEHLRAVPEAGTVPLLYPGHFKDQVLEWPQLDSKKPNGIQRNKETEKWLYPNGCYCVVRRFSSKEEKRRVMASVVVDQSFPDVEMLGFENHLNVFHEGKQGLPEALAYGLAAFLNSRAIDEYFRRFNGHTQVNATDLRLLKYPSREKLMVLGQWAMELDELTEAAIDRRLETLAI